MVLVHFFCKIGLHTGMPIETGGQDQTGEVKDSIDQARIEEFKCIRCDKVYTKMIGIDPTFLGHP
jgi:hypothetical protein